jgi:hypothetical protein
LERRAEPIGQSLERQPAVAQLRPLGIDGHAHDRAEALEQPSALPRPERRRLLHVESHLDARVRSVGVLPSGPATRREAPLELVERNPQ